MDLCRFNRERLMRMSVIILEIEIKHLGYISPAISKIPALPDLY